jgi:hypothetical protein
VRLAELPIPTTPAVTTATEVCAQFSSAALVNHCVRSYLFAAARAEIDGLEIDHELLCVAALLHDLTLEPAFDNVDLPFEDAGAHLAWVFTAGAGWPIDRRDRAGKIIIAHMQGADPAHDPEGYLLDLATGLDIGGRDLDTWPAELVAEIVERFPRLDLATRFTACFAEQARRKPDSTAGVAVRTGFADRIADNPLDRLG